MDRSELKQKALDDRFRSIKDAMDKIKSIIEQFEYHTQESKDYTDIVMEMHDKHKKLYRPIAELEYELLTKCDMEAEYELLTKYEVRNGNNT